MADTVFDVGSGQTYTTLADAVAALSNVGSGDRKIVRFHGAALTQNSQVTVTSITVADADSLIFEAADGDSLFDDNTAALRFNSAKAGLSGNPGSGNAFLRIEVANALVRGLQFQVTSDGGSDALVMTAAGKIEGNYAKVVSDYRRAVYASNSVVRNNVLIADGTQFCSGVHLYGNAAKCENNTFYTSNPASTVRPVKIEHQTNQVRNNAAIGFNNAFFMFEDGSYPTSSNNIGTCTSAGGGTETSNTWNATGSDLVENATSGSLDLRAKNSGPLDAGGVAISGFTTDAYGTTWGSPPTVGAHEVNTGGGGGVVGPLSSPRLVESILVKGRLAP